MQLLSQRDLWWANVKIGNTTIGKSGCVVTCLSMLTSRFTPFQNPKTLAKTLKFTPAGLILWQSCVFPHFKFEWREYARNDSKYRQYLADPNKAVILNVNSGTHWVLPVLWFPQEPKYLVADPWDGTYKSNDIYHDIVGAAYFTAT